MRYALTAAAASLVTGAPVAATLITAETTIALPATLYDFRGTSTFGAVTVGAGDTFELTINFEPHWRTRAGLAAFHLDVTGNDSNEIRLLGSTTYEVFDSFGAVAVPEESGPFHPVFRSNDAGTANVFYGFNTHSRPNPEPDFFPAGTFSRIKFRFNIASGQSMTVNHVAFFGGYVPEPATWAMMITGFGILGSATRARRSGSRSLPSPR